MQKTYCPTCRHPIKPRCARTTVYADDLNTYCPVCRSVLTYNWPAGLTGLTAGVLNILFISIIVWNSRACLKDETTKIVEKVDLPSVRLTPPPSPPPTTPPDKSVKVSRPPLPGDDHSIDEHEQPPSVPPAADPLIAPLAANPYDPGELAILKKQTLEIQDQTRRSRYLAIYYLGCLSTEQGQEAERCLKYLTDKHPGYDVSSITRDNFQGPCKKCEGDGILSGNCPACKGTGECSYCQGKGRVTFGVSGTQAACSKCNGRGMCGKCLGNGMSQTTCPVCKGTGTAFFLENVKTRYREELDKAWPE